MCLEFGDDFCAACEPGARIWHKGNDPIGRRPITIIMYVDLQETKPSSAYLMDTISNHSTHVIECVVASNKVVSACEAHPEIPTEVQDEGRKERRAPGGQKTPNYATRCTRVGLFLYTPKHVPHLFNSPTDLLSPRLGLRVKVGVFLQNVIYVCNLQ